MKIPEKMASGTSVLKCSKYINAIIDYLASSKLVSDLKTIRLSEGAGGITISAINQRGGGSGGSTSSEYNSYFKVIKDGEEYWIVDGANPNNVNCGSFTAGSSNVSCISEEIAVSGAGVVYLRIYYTTSYQYEFGFAAELPEEDQEIYIPLASISADGSIGQIWTSGAITYLNGAYVL